MLLMASLRFVQGQVYKLCISYPPPTLYKPLLISDVLFDFPLLIAAKWIQNRKMHTHHYLAKLNIIKRLFKFKRLFSFAKNSTQWSLTKSNNPLLV